MLDEQALNEYLNQDDPCVTTALRVFARNAAFPKKPLPAKPAAKKPAAKKPTAKKPARRATR
jgi:carboxyl-terminal processing protease